MEGQEFLGEEARLASDFAEIVDNLGMSPEEAYSMFKDDNLPVGKRLYFAVKLLPENATRLLLMDTDKRIGLVVKERLRKGKEANGSIIIKG